MNFNTPVDNTPRQNELQNLTPDQLERLSGLLKRGSGGVGLDAEKLASVGRNNNSLIHISVLIRNNQILVRTSDPSVLEKSIDSKIKSMSPRRKCCSK